MCVIIINRNGTRRATWTETDSRERELGGISSHQQAIHSSDTRPEMKSVMLMREMANIVVHNRLY